MMKLHAEKKPIATILLFKVKDTVGYGIAKFRGLENGYGLIEKVVEKPTQEEAEEYKLNNEFYALCGAYIFEPRMFDFIGKTRPGKKKEVQITDSIQLAIEKGEKVYGVILSGKYLDIGKWRTVFDIQKDMQDKFNIDEITKEREKMTDRVIRTLR